MFPLVDAFDDGMLPIVGGILDQANWFLEAARFVKNEDAKITKDLYDN